MTRIPAVVLLATSMVLGMSSTASADREYHTERVPLHSVDDAPLRSGSVVNIHADGPNIYAHERYVLNGAEPNHVYDIILELHVSDPDCSEAPPFPPLEVASVTTNVAGNGHGRATFSFEFISSVGLVGSGEHGVNWVFLDAGTPAYETGCEDVFLD